jgi:HAD superfamily hydrolase (TIGR01509 family)
VTGVQTCALPIYVDGTLAETEEVHRAAFNQAFREADLKWKWTIPLYGELLKVTGGKERMTHYAASIGHKFEGDALAAIRWLHGRKTQIYAEIVSSGVVALREGVAEVLQEAHAKGVLLGIATTTTADNVIALLNATLGPDSVSWFKAFSCGDMVPKKKPAPDIYLLALQQLGVTASEALAVEDSRNGILSSHAAGMKVAVRPGIYTESDDLSGADIRFTDARELLAYV